MPHRHFSNSQRGSKSKKMIITEFIKEYQEIFDGEPWHGESLFRTLETTSFHLTNFKPQENFHSIAELLKHLLIWRTFVIEKLNENQEYDIHLNSSLDWEEKVRIETPVEWNRLMESLKSSQQQIVSLLSGKEDGWLQQQTPGKSYTNQYMMMGIMHHDLYHLGQIRLIRKMAEEVDLQAK